jgi:hypothetical protein
MYEQLKELSFAEDDENFLYNYVNDKLKNLV